jgi:hypothetical protein
LISLEEEVKLSSIEVELLLIDHDGHMEGEHQLMDFENTQASVFIDIEGEFIDDCS